MSLLNAFILLIAALYVLDFTVAVICSYFPNLNVEYTFGGYKRNIVGISAVIYVLWHYGYITSIVG